MSKSSWAYVDLNEKIPREFVGFERVPSGMLYRVLIHSGVSDVLEDAQSERLTI